MDIVCVCMCVCVCFSVCVCERERFELKKEVTWSVEVCVYVRERESGETKIGVWRSHFSSKIYSAKIVLPPVCNFRTFKRLFIFGKITIW